MFDKNLLKDIKQLSLCCHTGNLEVYHSVQTDYVPKRQHFSYDVEHQFDVWHLSKSITKKLNEKAKKKDWGAFTNTKRQHFSYKGMVARTQLLALDHNANTGRQQATATQGVNTGEQQYKLVFPKHTKEWVAKPILEKTTRDHLKPMLDAIIDRKKQKPHARSATLATPAFIPKNIASKPRPPRAEVITKHMSRFSDN